MIHINNRKYNIDLSSYFRIFNKYLIHKASQEIRKNMKSIHTYEIKKEPAIAGKPSIKHSHTASHAIRHTRHIAQKAANKAVPGSLRFHFCHAAKQRGSFSR